MKVLYPLFIWLLKLGFLFGARFNKKLKLGLEGRRKSLSIVQSRFSVNDQVLWMHAASLGEYEQGLPVLEALEGQYPHYKTLITFFSPSGYEHIAKKQQNPNRVLCYLPFDLKREIQPFIKSFETKVFFTVKYDYWYTLLGELNRAGAQLYVVSALFYKNQAFFKPGGRVLAQALQKRIHWFFHQTAKSFQSAVNLGIPQGSVTGDTRFDRVRETASQASPIAYIQEFKAQSTLIVFGSSWEAEEKLAYSIIQARPETKIVLAPHDLKRVKRLTELFPHALLYSTLDKQSPERIQKAPVLIIDSIGLLSKLYQYGDLALVGGGFHSKGLHNCLEAASFGIPVFFGNQYKENPEADAIVLLDAGRSFEDEVKALEFLASLLVDPLRLKSMGENARRYVESQPYSSKLILEKIQEMNSPHIV